MSELGDIKVIGIEDIVIPDCCKEGWEDCPHVVNRPTRASKTNIGL